MMVARPPKVLNTPPSSRGTSPSRPANGKLAGTRGTSPSRIVNGMVPPTTRRSPAQSPVHTTRRNPTKTPPKRSTPGNSPDRRRVASQERQPIRSRGSSPAKVREELPKSRGSE